MSISTEQIIASKVTEDNFDNRKCVVEGTIKKLKGFIIYLTSTMDKDIEKRRI